MKVEIKKLEKARVELTISIDLKSFDKYKDQAIEKLSANVEVKGFRKGKAPKDAVIAKVGQDSITKEAEELAINETYPKAVKENSVEIVARPHLKEVKSNENGMTYIVEVAVKQKVVIPDDYAKFAKEIKAEEVTQEEVEEEINKALEQFTKHELVSRPAQDKDLLVIDFEGFIGDESFEGGKAERHSLELGSNSFIPGFEEQLIGAKANENKDIIVTFPEDYHAENLKGKEATFKVLVHEVKEKVKPSLDDSFVADMGRKDVKTVEDFKKEIKDNLVKEKENQAKNKAVEEALEEMIKDVKIEISEDEINDGVERKLMELEQQLGQQGLNLEKYFELSGQSFEDMKKTMTPEIEMQIKKSALLDAVAKKENIKITEKEIETELETMAKMYNMSLEQIKEALQNNTEMLKKELEFKKAINFLVK